MISSQRQSINDSRTRFSRCCASAETHEMFLFPSFLRPFKHDVYKIWSQQCNLEVSDCNTRKREGHSLSAFPEVFAARQGSRHSRRIQNSRFFSRNGQHRASKCLWRREVEAFITLADLSALKWLQFSCLQASFEGMTGRLSSLTCVSYWLEYGDICSVQLSFSKAIRKCMISPIFFHSFHPCFSIAFFLHSL